MTEPDRQQLVQENEALKSQLNELIHLAQGAPLGTGVCMCGDPIEEHGRAHNHSAVDVWDHAFDTFLGKHGLRNGTREPGPPGLYRPKAHRFS